MAEATATKPKKDVEQASNNNGDNSKNNNSNKKKSKKAPREYNPRWLGYTIIFTSSLINLSAVSNIRRHGNYQGLWAVALIFGPTSLLISLLVLLTDRTQCGLETFHYTKARDGKFEGGTLLFMTLLWIVGVAYMTQVNGIAYMATNVYVSAWCTLGSTVYTLNQWSGDKDILTFQELTSISATLKSWYILLLAALVVMGTSINMIFLVDDGDLIAGAMFGTIAGFVTTLVCLIFLLIHYNFIESISEGGWVEFVCSMALILLWIVVCSLLTSYGAIGATIVGHDYQTSFSLAVQNWVDTSATCTVVFDPPNVTVPCQDIFSPPVPGSNLYVSTWLCLATSLSITFMWKKQQALQFAQAHQRPNRAAAAPPTAALPHRPPDLNGEDEEEDDDLNEFQDATY